MSCRSVVPVQPRRESINCGTLQTTHRVLVRRTFLELEELEEDEDFIVEGRHQRRYKTTTVLPVDGPILAT